MNRRQVVEATACRYRTGAPWRDLPERFGKWNTVYKNFDRWARALSNYRKFGTEPPRDRPLPRGLTTKSHLVCDGRGRILAFVLTGGQVADTIMLPATLGEIRVPTPGRPAPGCGRSEYWPTRATPPKPTGPGCGSVRSLDDPRMRRPDRPSPQEARPARRLRARTG